MPATIHLTQEEQSIFVGLPENIRTDWRVETETGKFADSEEKRQIRFSAIKFDTPEMRAYAERASQVRTPEELLILVGGVGQADVSAEDMMQLFFAIGPAGISSIIERLLVIVQKAEDLQAIASLANIRKEISLSLQGI